VSRPRILVLSPYAPPADGIGEHTRALARALAADADVVVGAPGNGGRERDGDVEVRRLLGARAATPGRSRTLLADVDPDAVYVQFAISAFATALPAVFRICRAARGAGVPVVAAFHEAARELALLPGAGAAIYRGMLALTDVPVVLTPHAAAALAAAGADVARVAVVPHGVPALAAPPAAEVERVRAAYGMGPSPVLALGFVHPDKGADTLLAAVPALAARAPDATVIVAGTPRVRRGPFRAFGRLDRRHHDELRRAAAALPAGRVRFPGFVPAGDLAAVVHAAAVMALPYRRITQSGIAHLAVAAGAPVVASDLPGLRATFGEGARYVAAGDPAALGCALGELLADAESRRRLSAQQARTARAQSMSSAAAAVLDLVEGARRAA
jgi:glycosyltransferase involved in cell wall biosynthesis